LQRLSEHTFDIILTDMKMPGMDGLELFKASRKIDPNISGIIMTAFGSISSAVTSIKEGITDYIQKPFEPEALLMAVEKTLRERGMLREIRDLRKEVDQRYAFGNIIGKNHKMKCHFRFDPENRPLRCPGLYHRRNRCRKGAWWPKPFISTATEKTNLLWASIAALWRKPFSNRNCSATKKAPSPVLSAPKGENSNMPRGARFFWMKWVIFRPDFR
jgi:hypothetical protein